MTRTSFSGARALQESPAWIAANTAQDDDVFARVNEPGVCDSRDNLMD
jgi:hypothetical protein